jgi:hypothetical protein
LRPFRSRDRERRIEREAEVAEKARQAARPKAERPVRRVEQQPSDPSVGLAPWELEEIEARVNEEWAAQLAEEQMPIEEMFPDLVLEERDVEEDEQTWAE